MVWNGTPGGLRGSPWLLDIHIDPDVVYQARPSLSLPRKVREGPADVISIHKTLDPTVPFCNILASVRLILVQF